MSETTNDDARPTRLEAMQETITERIIADLKEGVPSWVKPWTNGSGRAASLLPLNAVSGKEYSGVNILMLWSEAKLHGYRTQQWLTFQQGKEIGARVRKGERSTPVIFVKFIEKDEAGEKKRIPVYRSYAVFNIDQMDSIPVAYYGEMPELEEDPKREAATGFCQHTGIQTIFGGNKAFYRPNQDRVVLPPYGSFLDDDAFFGTWLHELVHATGHKERLDRVYGQKFGDKAYAFEELVAELGSAFACSKLGYLPTTRTAASYIASWITVLENNPKAIVQAASYASAAVRFLEEQALHAVHDDTPDVERPQAA